MLSYLKTHAFSDAFIAGMRGVCVVAGLIGTFMMPLLERYLGLVRAGSWSIWYVFGSSPPGRKPASKQFVEDKGMLIGILLFQERGRIPGTSPGVLLCRRSTGRPNGTRLERRTPFRR